jgi:hypothetical protein
MTSMEENRFRPAWALRTFATGSQAYGERHRFETVEPAEGGFAVTIELPLASVRRNGREPCRSRRSAE